MNLPPQETTTRQLLLASHIVFRAQTFERLHTPGTHDCKNQNLGRATRHARQAKAAYAAVPSPTGVVSALLQRQLDDPHPQFFMHAHCNVLPSAAGLDLGIHSDAPTGAIPSGGAAHRGPPS